HHVDSLAGRPLLLVSGGQDKLVPPKCNRKFVKKCKASYAKAGKEDRFSDELEDEAGHKFTDWMRERTIEWVVRWMVVETSII
ncbi:hypothetical protein BDK51DRAFT_22150, partial [Blyttiomyces helicus]